MTKQELAVLERIEALLTEIRDALGGTRSSRNIDTTRIDSSFAAFRTPVNAIASRPIRP